MKEETDAMEGMGHTGPMVVSFEHNYISEIWKRQQFLQEIRTFNIHCTHNCYNQRVRGCDYTRHYHALYDGYWWHGLYYTSNGRRRPRYIIDIWHSTRIETYNEYDNRKQKTQRLLSPYISLSTLATQEKT